jgi:non-heme chloroperoxidase
VVVPWRFETGRLHSSGPLADAITSIGSGCFDPTGGDFVMASISERENREIEAANASDNTPVVFIHGLWLLPSSWANWADFFKQAGYAPLTPDWPGDPETVEEARAHPDVLAKKTLKQVADHTTEVINALDRKPAVLGHSTGGLLA